MDVSGAKRLKAREAENARRLIKPWQKEYNDERPKKGLSEPTPSQHAKQLAKKSTTVAVSL